MMDILVFALLLGGIALFFQRRDEHRRIVLMGSHLGQYQIEKLMETLTQGYMRALGETDPARQQQIWSMLSTTEQALCEQFKRFVTDFARVDAQHSRVSKLPLSIFYTGRWLPGTTFDLRQILSIHAQGIWQAAHREAGVDAKSRAFTMLAELFLMQHSCHWYCKSKTVASARLAVRHQTPYAKVLDSVSPATRQAYCALIGR
jgi:hypothetical protein